MPDDSFASPAAEPLVSKSLETENLVARRGIPHPVRIGIHPDAGTIGGS